MVITGNVGTAFDLTETNTTTSTGIISETYLVEASVGDLPISATDKAVGIAASIGTTAFDFDLYDIKNLSGGAGAGAYTFIPQRSTSPVVLATIKSILIHNKSATILTITPGSVNSYLPASEQITIPAGGSNQFAYSTAQTIGASKTIKIISNGATSIVEIYILGT